VPDPVRLGTDDAFEAAYTDLTHRIDRLAGALTGHDGDGDPTGSTPDAQRPDAQRGATS
jgi:hypothetical protein